MITTSAVLLTPRQSRFVEEYLIDLNGAAAARRAGYSPHTANEQAARLLADVRVRRAVLSAQRTRSERTGITADDVLHGLKAEAEDRSEGSSPFARVKALELLGRHLGMWG
jgi:phage terminase small subunit